MRSVRELTVARTAKEERHQRNGLPNPMGSLTDDKHILPRRLSPLEDTRFEGLKSIDLSIVSAEKGAFHNED